MDSASIGVSLVFIDTRDDSPLTIVSHLFERDGDFVGKNSLRDGLTITRRDDSAPFIVYCQACDWLFHCVSGSGNLRYKTALSVARKHKCVGINDVEPLHNS